MDPNPHVIADKRSVKHSAAIWMLVIAIPALCSSFVVSRLLLAAHTDMNVPVVYERDALYELAIFKGIGEGNLPWRNTHLGAPFGSSDWRDYPLYQWIDYSAFRFFSLFTNNYLKLLNWYWVLTIAVTGAIAAFCFLRLRASPVVAGCLAFLYALQPYVFARNISHFNLLCYLVPLLATACLEVAAGRWEKDGGSAIRQIPLYAWAGFLLQGISFFYFSFFGALLLLVAALFGACARRTVRPLIQSACLLVVLVGATVVGMSPTLVHWLQDGGNPAAVERSAAEAEVHGLKIRYLLTPVPTNPLPFLRKLSEIAEAKHQDHTEASTTYLGLLGSIGFIALMAYLFARVAGWQSPLDDGIVTACAILILGAFFWCTVGGFGSVFNTYITPVIRAYDRIIVFIVFFILAAYGTVVSTILAGSSWARAHSLVVVAGLLFITAISFADVILIPHGIQSDEARQTAASDRAFVSSIEQALGGRGMVFQLPYTEYPNGGGPGKILPFDHARPYIQSSANLQWSWGTVMGREEARKMEAVAQLPPDRFIAQIQTLGFRGLWIDTYGYTDAPSGSPVKALTALLGRDPMISPDGRYLFFDLASVHAPSAPPPTESTSLPFKPSEIRPGSSCSIDSINDAKISVHSATVPRSAAFRMDGWVADTDSGAALPDVYVEISNAGGKRFYLHGTRYQRPDVASHFNKPSLVQSGYAASGQLDALPPGSYRLRIVQAEPGRAEGCATDFKLDIQ